jgi:hypothetical protein
MFLQWCEENGIEDTSSLRGRHLHEFKKWRAEDVPTYGAPILSVDNCVALERALLSESQDTAGIDR